MAGLTCQLEPDSGTPLYEQLYRFVVGEILAGRLREGERLPSKRELCSRLQISQSTVETAYGLLVDEGYIRNAARVGFFVCPLERLEPGPEPEEKAPQRPAEPVYRYNFSTGNVDTSAFPYASWAKLTRETVYGNPELLQRGQRQGDMALRQALADFLHQYRGVACRAEQVVIGAGMEYLLDLVLQLLPRQAAFALEDPGYRATYRTVENNGRRILPIGLDEAGMDAAALEASGADVAYVTPSHQFPMGCTMPVGRRTQLLRWAAEKPGRYIIEDDYDSEFRHSSRPIPAMQGLDRKGRVIYIGTFSRSLAPGIRVAYLVLPEKLLGLYQQRFDYAACTVSRFEQQTLARFLERGGYARHLRRVGNLYRKRCTRLTELLAAQLPGCRIRGADAGLHFLLTVPGRSEAELVARAAKAGVRVHGLSQYCHQGTCPMEGTVVLGYAGLEEGELESAVAALGRAWRQAPLP